jgi:uncharacterized protein
MVEINEIKKIAKTYFVGANGCHAWDHTQRVLENAMRLGKIYNADLEILEISVVLHDIKKVEEMKSGGNLCHATDGAKEARKILKNLNYSSEKIKKVYHCVESHRKRNEIVPQTLEAKILFDADKLDSIGALGIGRMFMFASEVGAKLHDKDVNVEKTSAYSEDDTAYREFLSKMQYVKDKMLTGEGKKMAKERHKFMVEFFDRINKEVIGEL